MKQTGSNRRVFLRGDGGAKVGFGHVNRLLAVADMIGDFFDCYFVIKEPNEDLRRLILNSSVKGIVNFQKEKDDFLSAIHYPDIVVVDRYDVGTTYFQQIKSTSAKLVVIDDQNELYFDVDLLINHLLWAEDLVVKHSPSTKLLLGAKYALLRRAYLNNIYESAPPTPNSFLISLGASYTAPFVNRIIGILKASFKTTKISVLTSSFNAKEISGGEIFFNLSAEEVANLILEHEYVIVAPGMTSYEVFTIGRKVIMGSLNTTQDEIGCNFERSGLCAYVGRWQDINKESFGTAIINSQHKTINQRKVFDKKSGDRILNEFLLLS